MNFSVVFLHAEASMQMSKMFCCTVNCLHFALLNASLCCLVLEMKLGRSIKVGVLEPVGL